MQRSILKLGIMKLGMIGTLLVLILFVPFASEHPDGLEWVAEQLGFLARGEGEPLIHSLFPDYTVSVIGHPILSTLAAGGLGALFMFGLGSLLGYWLGHSWRVRKENERK